MKISQKARQISMLLIIFILCSTVPLGCTKTKDAEENKQTKDTSAGQISTEETTEEHTEDMQLGSTESRQAEQGKEPIITEMDWSEYFQGLNGAAVFYTPWENKYQIYNQELAETRRSPCSTFKIISALAGIENGIISREDSTRTWSKEQFWMEDWNKDIDFKEAFRTSCVWYFREVIDELGQENMKAQLDSLSYGNCDISDWEGHLNNNNNNPALTGFWIESSLKISPKEQVEVMDRIFGADTVYAPDTLQLLQEAMLITDQDTTAFPVYGKTGTGKMSGETVDSWFTGFVETEHGNVYFCVYLGQSDGEEVSSARAKEAALALIGDKI